MNIYIFLFFLYSVKFEISWLSEMGDMYLFWHRNSKESTNVQFTTLGSTDFLLTNCRFCLYMDQTTRSRAVLLGHEEDDR